MKFMEILVILTALFLSGNALQCYNCTTVKFNNVEIEESTTCEGSEITCTTDQNACMTYEISGKTDVEGVKVEAEETQTTCGKSADGDAHCQMIKADMSESVDDLKCSVNFCSTDLCNSSGEIAQISVLVGAFVISLYGILF